jgi:hypothetical protein
MTRLTMLAFVLFLTAAHAGAQNASVRSAVLVYADDITDLRAIDDDGRAISDVDLGHSFRSGDSIRTGVSGGAELRLEPNGTLLRLGPDATVRFDRFVARFGVGSNEMSVYQGKLRMVAARIRGAGYLVRTPATAAGVRGTDFVVDVIPGRRDAVIVRSGSVEVFSRELRRSVIVEEGYFVDALAEEFEPVDWDEWEWDDEEYADFDDYFDEIDFLELDVDDVYDDDLYENNFDYFDDEDLDEADWLWDEDDPFWDDDEFDDDDFADDDEYEDDDDDF